MLIAIWMFILKSALTTSMYRNTHRNLSIFIVLHLRSLIINEHCLTIKPQQNNFQRMIKIIWKGILWIVLNARNTVLSVYSYKCSSETAPVLGVHQVETYQYYTMTLLQTLEMFVMRRSDSNLRDDFGILLSYYLDSFIGIVPDHSTQLVALLFSKQGGQPDEKLKILNSNKIKFIKS